MLLTEVYFALTVGYDDNDDNNKTYDHYCNGDDDVYGDSDDDDDGDDVDDYDDDNDINTITLIMEMFVLMVMVIIREYI